MSIRNRRSPTLRGRRFGEGAAVVADGTGRLREAWKHMTQKRVPQKRVRLAAAPAPAGFIANVARAVSQPCVRPRQAAHPHRCIISRRKAPNKCSSTGTAPSSR